MQWKTDCIPCVTDHFWDDAHQPHELDRAKSLFEKAVKALDLQECDKYIIK